MVVGDPDFYDIGIYHVDHDAQDQEERAHHSEYDHRTGYRRVWVPFPKKKLVE
jgi:hypothetical protein